MSKIILPGLIDVHTHLRDPGQTHKEDFYTGTSAALAGGFTTVLDMPNNLEPITTVLRLKSKVKSAKSKVVCDVGFYFGSLGDNLGEFSRVGGNVFGLKLYLNVTTGKFLISPEKLEMIYNAWNNDVPILVHAEADVLNKIIQIVKKTGKRTHICHVSSKDELSQIIKAKEDGLPITCGVTPHHLFLTENDLKILGVLVVMKPSLKSKRDQNFLWKNLRSIDIIESDHAPHTLDEKNSSQSHFGVPGLETTLPLLLTAVNDDRLSLERVIELCHDNPRKIFNIPPQKDTYIEIQDSKFKIQNSNLHTKCGWSPYAGWQVRGKVKDVYIRGTKVFENDKILVDPGFGKVIEPL